MFVINRNLFAHLRKLELLSLDGNKLTTIDDSFRNLISLRKINLRNNQLSHNKTNLLFSDLDKLENINLSYNKLEEFSILNIRFTSKLEIVDLSNKKFQYYK